MKETNFNFKTGTSFEHFSARNKNLITMRDRGIFNFTSNLFKKKKKGNQENSRFFTNFREITLSKTLTRKF